MTDPLPPAFTAPPVGVLDSGVGGLSILREIRAQRPAEPLLYVADQAHVPYGPRTIGEVRAFTLAIARFLIAQQAKLIVVACNTASAAALHALRAEFPHIPFVGMEPAVKPAAHDTHNGVIGVIATEATFQGELFASVVGRFAQGVRVETLACPEFVLLAEAGETDTPRAREIIRRRLQPLLDAGIDQLVLGCTHFPFLKGAIQAAVGPGVTIVDPSPAVARQVGRVLDARGPRHSGPDAGRVVACTTGDPDALRSVSRTLLGPDAGAFEICALRWRGGALQPAP
ncbi:MAG: glutamate racemase [Anaerolineae bacterium]|nr:glutamate racemase [Anaerolineae bacterium]